MSGQVMRFPANASGRDFVVGDLHGCRKEFDALLKMVKFDRENDRMFSVGDLVDRGPDSLACLELLFEPWFHAVRGNHEQMMLDALLGGTDESLWMVNGGHWVWENRELAREICESHVNSLPVCIVVGDGADRFNIVHAEFQGSDADIDADEFSMERAMCCIWGRDVVKGSRSFAGLSPTYCGHTIVRGIARTASHIFIDTGAFVAHGRYSTPIDARLTMVEPRTGTVYESRRAA